MTFRNYTFSEHEIFMLHEALSFYSEKRLKKKPRNKQLADMMRGEFLRDLQNIESGK